MPHDKRVRWRFSFGSIRTVLDSALLPVRSVFLPSLREYRCGGATNRGGDKRFVLGLSGPRWIALHNKALPARSSRPSQGEGEVVFFTLPQGGSLRRNDEAGRGKGFVLGLSGPCWMGLQNKALPARSSRPSQGEGEISLRISLVEGEVGLLRCAGEDGIHRKF
jgi:hypothetical protein